MAGDNNEVKLEEIVLGVQDVFPNISQDRIRRVCQHYVAEKLPHPLGNAVDYFLSHPESGPLDTPGKPTTSVPIVHLSSDSDDDISILVPPPGAAQHGRAHAVPVCSNAAVDLGMPTSVLSSTGVSSSITVATSTPVRSSKGAASSVANTPTKVGVASSTVARSTPRQAQQLHLTPQTNSTVVRKSVAASTSTPTRGMDAANPNTVGIGRTSIDSAQHPEQPLLQEDLHERVEVGAALAAVATSEQLSPLFTGDATDGAMNRHYNQVGAAITRVSTLTTGVAGATATAGAGPGVAGAGNVRPSLSYRSFAEPAMTATSMTRDTSQMARASNNPHQGGLVSPVYPPAQNLEDFLLARPAQGETGRMPPLLRKPLAVGKDKDVMVTANPFQGTSATLPSPGRFPQPLLPVRATLPRPVRAHMPGEFMDNPIATGYMPPCRNPTRPPELEHRRRIQQLQQTLQQKLNQRHQGAEGPWQGLGQHQQEADLHLYAAQQLQQQLQRQRELQQQEQQQRQQQEQQRQQQQQQQQQQQLQQVQRQLQQIQPHQFQLPLLAGATAVATPAPTAHLDLEAGDNERVQPVAQKPAFYMHEVKQRVMSMFPDIEEHYLEDLINTHSDDHANRVCNYLLEHSGFPCNPSTKKKKAVAASSAAIDYLKDDRRLDMHMCSGANRLLLSDFPQVAAADIKTVLKQYGHHYSPARQHIEKCLRDNIVVGFEQQLVEGTKLQAAQNTLSALEVPAQPAQGWKAETDARLQQALKDQVNKLLDAPPPGLPLKAYDNYKRHCVKYIRTLLPSRRLISAHRVSKMATDLVNCARAGDVQNEAAKQTAATTGQNKPQQPLALLKFHRKVSRPQNLPEELKTEVDYYEKHLKINFEEKQSSQPAATADSADAEVDEGQLMECGCCYGDVSIEKMVQCTDGHLFCEGCLCSYVKEAVYGQGKSQLACMTDGCDSTFMKSQLRKALTEDVLSKYDERVQEESIRLAEMAGLVQCPFCDFKALMAPDDKVFRCANDACLKESCRYCQEEWDDHFGKPCSEVEKRDETKMRTRVEEMMTEAKVRKCAKCRTEFTKESGCNKMTCRCGASMCYVCRKAKITYQHFCSHVRNPGQDCKQCKACSLWTDTKADDAQAIIEVREEFKRKRFVETGEEFDKLIGPPPDDDGDGGPAKKRKKT
eukprot:scpid37164/ scgid3120/ E3 ubiquitin-protein ligase RNF216; RING finger protein 216; Triad domain-containing protein 3; UbcM4-interacting protein 83; Ubiquitin-conjugating enzyme 7-interacting protein 1